MYRIAAVFAAIGVTIAGCAGIDGESTSCRDFNGMSPDARGATVAKMLKERTGRNASTSDVQARVEGVGVFCASNVNQDKTIGDLK